MEARLRLAVREVSHYEQRKIEEELLRFGLADAVLFVFPGVAFVPVEANDSGEVIYRSSQECR
jgi:hypothetical protein